MSDGSTNKVEGYLREGASWAADRAEETARSKRLALLTAGVASTIAILEAFALVALMPLKTVVPYTLLVDRQTGNVRALDPFDKSAMRPSEALTKSFLAQYVIAREGFDINRIQEDYRKVALMSSGQVRTRYMATMKAGNPESPLATLSRATTVDIEVLSLLAINERTELIRFASARVDASGRRGPPQIWSALVKYRYSLAAMSEADRLANPLGFQVTYYRKTEEIPAPVAMPSEAARSKSSQEQTSDTMSSL